MKTSFNADAHFVIGKNHRNESKPCQDHALSKDNREVGVIAVSDGCSGSTGHTDIGARLITCAATMALQECADFTAGRILTAEMAPVINRKIRSLLQSSRSLLGLETTDLYATCVYALLTPQGGLIHVLGDGSAILMYRDGSIEYFLFAWNANRPYYPVYADNGIDVFLSDHDKENKGEQSLRITKTRLMPDGSRTDSEEILPVREAIKGWTMIISQEAVQNALECVVICSDGVESFVSGTKQHDQAEIIKEITSFKVWKGVFVKRCLSHVLRTFKNKDIEPFDDISCAAIHINHTT